MTESGAPCSSSRSSGVSRSKCTDSFLFQYSRRFKITLNTSRHTHTPLLNFDRKLSRDPSLSSRCRSTLRYINLVLRNPVTKSGAPCSSSGSPGAPPSVVCPGKIVYSNTNGCPLRLSNSLFSGIAVNTLILSCSHILADSR